MPARALPRPLQQIQGQTDELAALIEHVRLTRRQHTSLSDKYYSPVLNSPLDRAQEAGQSFIQRLLNDPAFIDIARQRGFTIGYLRAIQTETGFNIEVANTSGDVTLLDLGKQPQWNELKAGIERAALSLGGQIRSDRLLTLTQALRFYGLASVQPSTTATLSDLIHQLEEKLACIESGLENGVNVGSLIPTTEHDKVLALVGALLDEGETSVIDKLANEAFPGVAADALRASPAVYLLKLLKSNSAENLARQLLESLEWYGANPDEDTPAFVGPGLVAEALRLWYCLSFDEQPGTIAGFRLSQPACQGASYRALRRDFERHLLDSGRVNTTTEQIMLGRLLLSRFPVEFQVHNIPDSLPYARSVVWVNFVHGAHLAHTLDPGLLLRLTAQQLIDFPFTKSEHASEDQLQLITLTRIAPALEWYQATQGFSGPLEIDALRALTALDTACTELNKAIFQLDVPPPQRLDLAKNEIAKVFGKTHFLPDTFRLITEYDQKRFKRAIFHEFPDLPPKRYEFHEVYAGNGFKNGKTWALSLNGVSKSGIWLSLDEQQRLQVHNDLSTRDAALFSLFSPDNEVMPDIKSLFNDRFEHYLSECRTAYQHLIENLLVTLPWHDRQCLARGEIKLFSLRAETESLNAWEETDQNTHTVRTRRGFVLQVANAAGIKAYYECLPCVGVIRLRADITPTDLGGTLKDENFVPFSTLFLTLRKKTLKFDWDAHEQGVAPRKGVTCEAIIDQVGPALPRPKFAGDIDVAADLSLTSLRTREIASLVGEHLLYLNPTALRAEAWGSTSFDRDENSPGLLDKIKAFIPFWGSIDSLRSNSYGERLLGALGLFIDIVSFGIPLGKFVAGSIRLLVNAGRVGIRATLPAFSKATGKLLTATLQNANPLAIIPAAATLTRFTVRMAVRGAFYGGRGLYQMGSRGVFRLRRLTGHADQFDFINGLPQVSDPGRWKPLASGDELASLSELDDVPLRNIAATGEPKRYLLDPLTSKLYGPRLSLLHDQLSMGQSSYQTLKNTDSHVLIELPESSQVLKVLEIDGRTSVIIDGAPYRLEDGTLRHVNQLEIDDILTAVPCRLPRAPTPKKCETRYVKRTPAPTPSAGTFDESKGWAPWFGDSLYLPGETGTVIRRSAISTHPTLNATMEFQKGIYGRVKITVPDNGQIHVFEDGAIIMEARNGNQQYVFTRLNDGEFYVAKLEPGTPLAGPLTLNKASTLPKALREELLVVYTGSLNANNMVRLYGVNKVEQALRAMDEIAVPIGSIANPPGTLRLLKVDTSPSEAALFDHRTRQIVRSSTDGANTWSASKNAPDTIRQVTADVFNELFQGTVVRTTRSTAGSADALKIEETMNHLQQLVLSGGGTMRNPRNIAFAEVMSKTGQREIYVSVSGNQGDTASLPLFASHPGVREVKVGETSYFNIDTGSRKRKATSLAMTAGSKFLAIPHTIDNIKTYTPNVTLRPTSLDTETKIIEVLRNKYPDTDLIDSVTIATTLAPCDSCSVIMKQFAFDGGANALNVTWK